MIRVITDIQIQSISGVINHWDGPPEHQYRCQREFEATVPGIIRNNQKPLNDLLSRIIIPFANEQLGKMTLSDLLDLINGNGNGLPIC